MALSALWGIVAACGSGSNSGADEPDASSPAEDCEGVDCGEHGECDDSRGEAVCLCEDDFRAEGLRCVLDCGVWTSPQEFDVPGVQLGGTVTVDGAAPELTVRLRFESVDGARFTVEVTPEGLWRDTRVATAASETITVAAGAYEVHVERRATGYPVSNPSGPLTSVELYEDTSIDLDIPVVHVAGSLTIAGEPSGSSAALRFVGDDEESFTLLIGASGEFPREPDRDAVPMLPGTYRIYYDRFQASDPSNPRNEGALIETVELSEDTTLSLELAVVQIDGILSVGGTPSSGGARVHFESDDGDTFSIPTDAEGAFAAPIVPGTYRASYESGTSDALTHPRNQRHVLRDVKLEADKTLSLEVPIARLSGTLAIDGEPAPIPVALRFIPEDERDGVGFQIDVGTDGELRASPTATDVPIAPGRYRVEYQVLSLTEPVPPNRETLLTSLEIREDKQVALDVPVVQLTGSFTVNGHPANEVYSLRFELEDGGFFDANTREDGSLLPDGFPVVAGEYRVYYRAPSTSPSPWNEPPNRKRLLAVVDLTADGSVALDLPVVVPRGEVKTSGASLGEDIALTFREVHGPDSFLLNQPAGKLLEEALVLPGTYRVRYAQTRSSEATPMVENYDLGCWILEEPDCGPTCCVPAPERVLSPEPLADVLFTTDNSGTMAGGNRWDTLVTGMTAALPRFDETRRMGLWLFPREAVCDAGGVPSRPVGRSQAELIALSLNNALPGGGTPTRDAVASAGVYLSGLLRSDAPRFMVLLAEGLETCDDDIDGAVAELEALYESGIETFVVGVTGGEAGPIPDLNRLAEAGGRPRDGSLRFYPGMTAAQVEDSLDEILSQVTSCRYNLPSRPVLPDELEVWADGEAVPRDEISGWAYRDESLSGIEIRGPICDAILEDELEVTAAVRC